MSSSLLGPHSPLEAMSKLCDWERPWDFALHDLWAGDVVGTSTWLGQVCQCPSRHVQEDPRPLLPRLPLALLISSPYSFPFLPSPQPFLARLSPSRWGCPSFCMLASFFLDISLCFPCLRLLPSAPHPFPCTCHLGPLLCLRLQLLVFSCPFMTSAWPAFFRHLRLGSGLFPFSSTPPELHLSPSLPSSLSPMDTGETLTVSDE